MNEKQLEMEAHMRDFLADIYANEGDTIIGMLKPEFVSCDAGDASLVMSYPAMPWQRNPIDLMQGGVVATILDFSIACLATYYGSRKAVTVSLQTSYLRGCPINGTLIVRVRATFTGRSMIHAYAECWEKDSPEKLVATCVGVYKA